MGDTAGDTAGDTVGGGSGAAIARRVTVSGRVQGVWFRESTRQQAADADVRGWVRNLPAGTLEAHLEGSPDAVDRLLAFLRSGPPHASVDDVDVREAKVEGFPDFQVR